MISIPLRKVNELKKKFAGKKIAVIGDLMLDCYFWGGVSRISPEAPVPVVEVDDEIFRFGGALNVANNISTLKSLALPIGIVGNDNDGMILKSLLKKAGISDRGVITDRSRPTTTKTRVIANKQHVVRIDKEKTEPISGIIEKKIIEVIKKEIKNLDAIILQDYNKGVLNSGLIQKIIDIASESKKIVTVDPKFSNFFEYKNVTVFKPNRKETEDAFGIRINTEKEIEHAGKKLLAELNAKYVLLTLSEKGIALFEKGKPVRKIPTKSRKVADVSGAGDTVISTLTVALSAGVDIFDAAYLANFAGGLVIQEVGIVPVELDNLFNAVIKELR